MSMIGASRKTPRATRKRVTFVLADAEHKIVLVQSYIPVRLKKSEHDRNVYEGPILSTWQRLPVSLRQLEYVGVLISETGKEFQHTIHWLEEVDPDAEKPAGNKVDQRWATIVTPAARYPAS